MRILEGQGVTKNFGGLAAVSDVDFQVDKGEIVGLIGPNGAGKTTLFNLISAALPVSSGEIRFRGQRLNDLKPHQICRMGISRTFQETKVFGNMPVLQNVLVGAFFGTPERSEGQTVDGLDLKGKTWKPTVAGILSIIAGIGQVIGGIVFVMGSTFLAQFTGIEFIGGVIGQFGGFLASIAALLIISGAIAVAGGIYALRRRFWELALIGSVCALPSFVFGIPAIIFEFMAEGEFRPSASWEAATREATQALEFVGLSGMSAVPVKDLTLVNQKRVEVARALATKPELLLLDELMAGLTPTEVSEAMELVTRIRDKGITVLMVEHVMKAIMGICERIVVLHHGEKIAEGTPQEIAANSKVIEIYLGEAAHAGS